MFNVVLQPPLQGRKRGRPSNIDCDGSGDSDDGVGTDALIVAFVTQAENRTASVASTYTAANGGGLCLFGVGQLGHLRDSFANSLRIKWNHDSWRRHKMPGRSESLLDGKYLLGDVKSFQKVEGMWSMLKIRCTKSF